MSLSTFPVMAYHGCDATVADEIINKRSAFGVSTNEYDWLGEGTYFWIGSYARAMDWAVYKKGRGEIKEPAVIGALVELRLCLNLTDLGKSKLLLESYTDLKSRLVAIKQDIPENSTKMRFGIPLFRNRDCAVIQNLHTKRAEDGRPGFDTIIGAFEEGAPAFEGAAIRERSHIQLAVRSPSCIVATFR